MVVFIYLSFYISLITYLSITPCPPSSCRTPENPAGWVPLVVAENKLGNQIILDRMNQVTNFPTWVMNYGGFKGTYQLQSAFAGLLNRTFVKEPVLEPDNFCILSGCR